MITGMNVNAAIHTIKIIKTTTQLKVDSIFGEQTSCLTFAIVSNDNHVHTIMIYLTLNGIRN